MQINIGYTTAQRDARIWSAGDIIINNTTNQVERYNGSSWVVVGSSAPNAVIRSVQTTRRTGGSPSGYYPDYTTTSQLDYIGIDYPDVALKATTTYRDTWTKLIAPPIATAASGVAYNALTANWTLDTYWNSLAFVNEVISYYELQYSTSSTFASGNTLVSGITTTTYVITGLTASTTYYYRVRAINGTEISDWSSTITQATPVAPTQNDWLNSYTNNLFKDLDGTVGNQNVAIGSIDINTTDFWAVANIPTSTPAASAVVVGLSQTGTRKFHIRTSGTFQSDVLFTSDAAVTNSALSTPTFMNTAGRVLIEKSGTTVRVYLNTISNIVQTFTLTTAATTTTVNQVNVAQAVGGGNIFSGIQKLAIFTGALPGTANEMLIAL